MILTACKCRHALDRFIPEESLKHGGVFPSPQVGRHLLALSIGDPNVDCGVDPTPVVLLLPREAHLLALSRNCLERKLGGPQVRGVIRAPSQAPPDAALAVDEGSRFAMEFVREGET